MLLVGLPKELIRHICSYLPCESALEFILVCRSTYQACDDWTVWRTVAIRSGGYISPVFIPTIGNQSAWKQYVIAATKAEDCDGHWTTRDLEDWLPQVVALGHPTVLQGQTSSLMQLYNLSLHDPAPAQNSCLTPPGTAVTFNTLSLHTWHLAQAAAFTVSVHYLAMQTLGEDCGELLCAVPWLPTNSPDFDQSNAEMLKKLTTIQHALANRVVGFFAARLRLARSTTSCKDGIYDPPSATTIPFSRQMSLPIPFMGEGLEDFCQCHLPAMADPRFITGDLWTGCMGFFSNHLAYGSGFNSIGGNSWDGIHHPEHDEIGDYPNGRSFEGIVRFELVSETNTSYTLQSNNFYSEGDLHRVRLDIIRKTGQLTMRHWNRMQVHHNFTDYFMITDGVITPFGIVSHMSSPGRWLWLWKLDWSAGPSKKET
jgi:hypothetical protein